MRDIIGNREPGEDVADVLLRGVERLLSQEWTVESDDELVRIRAQLIVEVAPLRAVALRRIFDVLDEWAEALARAFPDELDIFAAHAAVGSVAGAVISTAMANLRLGPQSRPMAEVAREAARRAV